MSDNVIKLKSDRGITMTRNLVIVELEFKVECFGCRFLGVEDGDRMCVLLDAKIPGNNLLDPMCMKKDTNKIVSA